MHPEDMTCGRDPLSRGHMRDPDIEPGILTQPVDGSFFFGRQLPSRHNISHSELAGTDPGRGAAAPDENHSEGENEGGYRTGERATHALPG